MNDPDEYFNLYAYCISFIINLGYVSPTGTYPEAERAICAVDSEMPYYLAAS
jgi:hypothetical protein